MNTLAAQLAPFVPWVAGVIVLLLAVLGFLKYRNSKNQ
jgi:hypothetical protein